MASNSPGPRILHKEASLLEVHPTDDAANIHGLSSLCDIFMSSFGQHGHVKVIHNNCGGDVVLTSVSEQILEFISISRPVLKLITTVIKEHIKTYSDGGLFVGIFALKLILNGLKLDIHHRLIIEVYDLLLKECIKLMESVDYQCKQDISTADGDLYIKLVRSMYSSKPACLLFDLELDHLCQLTIDGYRKRHVYGGGGGHSPGAATLLYVMVEGKPPDESKLVSGILYESPHIPVYCQHSDRLPSDKNPLPVVLVQTSMAGDSDAFLDVNYELSADIKISEAVESQLLCFAENIVMAGQKALICQKVIHPKVKKYLREHDVIALDRFGYLLFEAVHILAGGNILDPFCRSASWHYMSVLGHVEHVVINDKSYLHLDGVGREEDKSTTVCTVIVCHRTMHAVQEVKMIYERCQHILSLTEKCQQVLCGGGCWQSALLLHIRNNMPLRVKEWVNKLDCSKLLLSQIIETFLVSLQQIVMLLKHNQQSSSLIDTSTGHHFISSTDDKPYICNCGVISYVKPIHERYVQLTDLKMATEQSSNFSKTISAVNHITNLNQAKVIDAYLPFLNGMKAAVSISCMVLGIQNYIHENN